MHSSVGRLNPDDVKELATPPQSHPVKGMPAARHNTVSIAETRIASLKVLALSLLGQIESLEAQLTADTMPELNLQKEVHRFEAALIHSALTKTGGRQRRAARLLGVKVTTLNTKIKRHRINLEPGNNCSTESDGGMKQANVESDVVS